MTESALKLFFTYFSQIIWEKYVFFLDFSQLFWEKYVFFFTSPNFFGRCLEKDGRCHNKLGDVIFFSMTESALTFIFTYFSQLFWEKSVEVSDISQNIWEMSDNIWEKYVASLHASPKLFWLLPTFMTSPYFNLKVRGHLRSFFFPRDKVSPCHIHLPTFLGTFVCIWLLPTFLGEVISLLHTSPNFFGRSMFIFWLLPTFLGDVRKKLGDVITSWEKSFFSQWQKVH